MDYISLVKINSDLHVHHDPRSISFHRLPCFNHELSHLTEANDKRNKHSLNPSQFMGSCYIQRNLFLQKLL